PRTPASPTRGSPCSAPPQQVTGRRGRAAAAPRSKRSAGRETRKRLCTPEKRMGAAAASAAASRPESGRLQTETGQGQTRSDPTTRWSRQRKSQDLLQRFEQLLVLIVRADRDADPPRRSEERRVGKAGRSR